MYPRRYDCCGYDSVLFRGAAGLATMDRDNVAQILILVDKHVAADDLTARKRPKKAGLDTELRLPVGALAVVNTHLLFNVKRGDVKMCQLHYLMNRTHEFIASLCASGAIHVMRLPSLIDFTLVPPGT